MPRPDEVIARLRERGVTLATAESVTGGAVCAALVSVPGASAAVRGGVIAYTATMKERLLGVDPALIGAAGVVSQPVAEAMARGVRDATGATLGVATTGAAGPEPHGDAPVGRVWVAVSGPLGDTSVVLDEPGDREHVRTAAVDAALALVLTSLAGDVTVL